MERREAPRSGRGSVRPALRSADLRAKLPGPKTDSDLRAFEGVGVPGRAGPCEGPGASRRSIADRVVGGRTVLGRRASRSTTSLAEIGAPGLR